LNTEKGLELLIFWCWFNEWTNHSASFYYL